MNTDPAEAHGLAKRREPSFLSVSSVKISGKNIPPDRASVPAETDSPVGFPAEICYLQSIMPGRVPAVWLTLMPPIPLGTTTMPAARMSGSQAAGNARLAVVQFSCGFSTGRPWVDGPPAGVPSGPDEMPDKEPGAIGRNWR